MRYSLLSAFVIRFSALVQATFSSPKSGDSWVIGQENSISWDSSSTSGAVDISLCPAGAKDTTVIIAQIATQVDSSSGSYKWTSDKSLKAESVVIVIVDSKKSYTSSDTFILIDESSSSSSSSSNEISGKGKNSTETKADKSSKYSYLGTKTHASVSTETKAHGNSSTEQTKSAGSKSEGSKATKSSEGAKNTGSVAAHITNSIIIEISGGGEQASATATQTAAGAAVAQTTAAAAAEKTTTNTKIKTSTSTFFASNTSSLFLATGTGSGPPQAAFTGAAAVVSVGGTVAGGLFGLLAALFL